MSRRRRFAVRAVLALVGLLLAYPLAAWIGSSIPRNPGWTQPDTGVVIFVETNGFHTGLVVPITNEVHDWTADFPFAGGYFPDGREVTHIDIGWGERSIFLDTPEWSDLDPATAGRIAFLGGDTLLRITPYSNPPERPWRKRMVITLDEYERLVGAIRRTVPAPREGPRAELRADYAPTSRYYPATGRYWLGRTCNQWTSDMLAEAGVRTGWWTPIEGGVMKWVSRLDRQDEASGPPLIE
ncbi:DUF2459 domain-containing protein [Qipengyuania sp. JC766]|uniref:DUF2459 domain-containing protein n=1 Tax=Qipengyuania sp. JC766 TaxID=3232139 RepID=UPI003459F81F